MRKLGKIFCIVFCILVILLTGSYVGLSVYYTDDFIYGTWINGLYCTGKSVEEVNSLLTNQVQNDRILVDFADGEAEELCFLDAGVTFSFTDSLMRLKEAQNKWTWPLLFVANLGNAEMFPSYSIDRKQYEEAFSKMQCVKARKPDEAYAVKIQSTKDGYVLLNERVHLLNKEKAQDAVYDALLYGKQEVDLEETGCYEDLALSPSMQETINLYSKVNDFQNCGITYVFGDEEVPIGAGDVAKWLILDENGDFTFDENGNLAWNEDALLTFADDFLKPYNTLGGERHFQTTRGDIVTIKGGTYGNQIDVKAEKEYLLEAFSQKRCEKHEPKYIKKALYQGLDDIGDTYIEVDMGSQMLYYYVDGKQEIATPIVTGNMMRKRDTPSCVCFVYGKQKNRTLRGPGYASFVHFWMPVKRGIGIHDAPWRDEFGGDIYKTQGSHGCINTPYEPMEKLYDMADVGTPVVMFY